MSRGVLDESGEIDYGSSDSSVTQLVDAETKLDEMLLDLIGDIAVMKQLLSEKTPKSKQVIARLKAAKAAVLELPEPKIRTRRAGFKAV